MPKKGTKKAAIKKKDSANEGDVQLPTRSTRARKVKELEVASPAKKKKATTKAATPKRKARDDGEAPKQNKRAKKTLVEDKELAEAVRKEESTEKAAALLKSGSDPNSIEYDGPHVQTMLQLALRNNSDDVVVPMLKLLLDHGADLSLAENREILFDAVSRVDTLNLLIEKGASVHELNTNQIPLLHSAIETGNADCVTAVLRAGSKATLLNNSEETALHCAANPFHTRHNPEAYANKIIPLLVENGAPINAKNDQEQTALYIATQSIDAPGAVIEALIAAGADVTLKAREGKTALHEAGSYSNVEAIKILVKHGANVNEVDNHSGTSLHTVAFGGFWKAHEAAQVLLDAGADASLISTYCGKKQTPLQLAKSTLRNLAKNASSPYFDRNRYESFEKLIELLTQHSKKIK